MAVGLVDPKTAPALLQRLPDPSRLVIDLVVQSNPLEPS